MKKVLFLMIFAAAFSSALVAGDIPFFKSLFIGDEEYVRQEIMKCKDVEKVELERRAMDENDDIYRIHVYLSNHRYIQFSGLLYRFKSDNKSRFSMIIFQINDLHPIEHCFDAGRYDVESLFYRIERKALEVRLLKRIIPYLKIDNMLDVINNFDEVYKFVSKLPELPLEESFYIKYFNYEYNKTLESQLPEEFKNEIPFSIIQKEEYDRGTYESAYKFYKTTVSRAVKEFGYDNLKYGYENRE